jgi:hypothetical protein
MIKLINVSLIIRGDISRKLIRMKLQEWAA